MPALLVSVRDRAEARLCLTAGVDVIDIKDPSQGSLGQASPEAIRGILDEVAARRRVSAALGELADWSAEALPAEIDRLSFVKWGLARCPADWTARLATLRGHIEARSACAVVVVAYADFHRARAPSPDDVCHCAIRTRARVLLIDTWAKDGTRLSDWLSRQSLARIIGSCHDAGVQVALSGSLGQRDLVDLLPLAPDWFAVRGAACGEGRRDGPLDAVALAGLVAVLKPATPAD